ncbi:MAG: DUF3857 and transglutaminase domain-containing protein [Acidobacteria bacterium]|nr:DUF3857 and transglutaminase domain-containing protein [Acidobacteriota bacterium]
MYAKTKVPDWVVQAAAESLPNYPPKTSAVILLNDEQFTVNAQGETIKHVRTVWKLLRPKARKDISEVAVGYRRTRDKLVSMRAWSIGPDGKQYSLEDKDMREADPEGGYELYSDYRIRYAMAPAVDVGSIVALEYEITSHPFVSDFIWYAQDNYPIRQQRLLLTLPEGSTYKSSWRGEAPVEARNLEHGKTVWEMSDVPAVDVEDVPMSPSPRTLMSRLDIHYTGLSPAFTTEGTWSGIGKWYEQLAENRNSSNDRIAEKARELTAGKTDFADRAQAIGEFVQQRIRYVAVEIGVGGFQPHAASEIFSHEYGDCKDKATLFSAMMKAAGMRSTWLMVDFSRGTIAPDSPSIAANHMIAAIELPEGYSSSRLHSIVTAKSGKRYLIFDPTSEKTPFGQLESELQGGYGLLMEGAASEIIQLPVLSPENNLVRRTASFHLDNAGVLSGTVMETRSGDIAKDWRYVYTYGTLKQQEAIRDSVLGRDLTSFQLTDVKVENAASLLKDLTVSYRIEADHFVQHAGNLLMVRPRVIGSTGYTLNHKKREIPIDLGESKLVQDEYEIELPAGYAVDELPAPVKVDMGFAEYESQSEVKDGKLHYKRTYTVRDVMLPASKYKDLQQLAGVIENDEQSMAILKKVN